VLQQGQCHILLCWCRVSVKHGAGLALLGGLSPLANDMCGHCDPLGHKENKSLWDFREPFQNWVWKKVTRSTSHLPCTWLKLDDCVIGPIGSSVSWTWGQNTSRWKDEREEGKIFEYQYSKFTCVPTTNAKIYHNSHCQSFRFTVLEMPQRVVSFFGRPAKTDLAELSPGSTNKWIVQTENLLAKISEARPLKIKWGISPTFTISLRVPFVKSVTEQNYNPAFSHFSRSMGAGHSHKKDANIGPIDTRAKVIACWNLREPKSRW